MTHETNKGERTGFRFPVVSRRDLLRRAAWIAAASGLPYGAKLYALDVSPVMTTLSTYMSEARNRTVPDKAADEAKHHILDTLGAMISGSQLPPGRRAIQFARAYGGEKVATIVGSQLLCGPIEAAMVNGELAHSDETDDYYSSGGAHPGCSIVPATLAIGEQFDIGGLHFLRAVALGYDIGLRVLKTVGDGMFVRENWFVAAGY